MKKLSIFTLLLFSLQSGLIHGQSSKNLLPYKLEEIIATSLANNPQLQAKRNLYEAARAEVPVASALPNPKIQITEYAESVQTRTGPQERVFMFSQKLPWFGKLSQREKASLHYAEVLWFDLMNTELELKESLSNTYFDYTYNDEAIMISTENLFLLKSLEPIVSEKVRTGGNLNSLIKLKVEIGKLEDTLESIKQKQITLTAMLDELLGLQNQGYETPVELKGPVLIETYAEMDFSLILESHPNLKKMKSLTNKLTAKYKSAELESYPDVNLGINYIQIGDSQSSSSNSGKDPWGLTLAVEIPIWQSKNKALRTSAKEKLIASEKQFSQQKNQLLSKYVTTSSQLKDAKRRSELYGNELLKLAEQALENSRMSYQTGSEDILDLIDSERTLLDLQILHQKSISDTWKAYTTLLLLDGKL
jgi:outer membrane protein TolC